MGTGSWAQDGAGSGATRTPSASANGLAGDVEEPELDLDLDVPAGLAGPAAPSEPADPSRSLPGAVLQLLRGSRAGLSRADLRRELAVVGAARLAPGDLAQLDSRLGHALSQLKSTGDVVHHGRRRVWELRHHPVRGHELEAPPLDARGLGAAEQSSLF